MVSVQFSRLCSKAESPSIFGQGEYHDLQYNSKQSRQSKPVEVNGLKRVQQ